MRNLDGAQARAVAFYLPQFYPIPENDDWWGKGFTEWTNLAKARPLFRGHDQPLIPGDLGFYDLRLPETRQAQADLATAYGIEAFAYWHYWFGGGKRILERPFAEVLESGQPDMKFCLAWANQTWSGIWHGAPNKVLIEQTYPGPGDDQAHFESILPAFRDERYLRVSDRPVFYVFRPEDLPDPSAFVDRWQRMARSAGLDGLYLVAEVSDLVGAGPRYSQAIKDGFDAGAYMRLPADQSPTNVLKMRLRRKLRGGPEVYPYSGPHPLAAGLDPAQHLPVIYPNWDNTPRSGRGGIALTGSHPEAFQAHVRAAVDQVSSRPQQERLVWIKSWNEWAEGNHLEPDAVHGHGWLRAISEELIRGE
jgi:lipopolysaccharide biosynthesis protein